jgi:hypothetical protein
LSGAGLGEAHGSIGVSAVASGIGLGAVERALKARRRRPMFMVDLAVPRDIEPEVAQLEDVYLFTVDDLQSVVNENMENRRQAAREADQMIATEVDRFEAAATEHFAPVLAAPVLIDGLALFEEPAAGTPFVATRHFPFPHSAAEVAA